MKGNQVFLLTSVFKCQSYLFVMNFTAMKKNVETLRDLLVNKTERLSPLKGMNIHQYIWISPFQITARSKEKSSLHGGFKTSTPIQLSLVSSCSEEFFCGFRERTLKEQTHSTREEQCVFLWFGGKGQRVRNDAGLNTE